MVEAVAAEGAPAAPAEKKPIFQHVTDSVQAALAEPASADAELLFIGAKNSGKSTLVHAFLQKDEPPKPSTPLEFRYARRAAGANSTTVANVWEVGGGMTGASQLSELLKVVLLPEMLARAVVAIVLDMSEPDNALPSLITQLKELRARVSAMQLELAKSPAGSAITEAARKATGALWADHDDAALSAVEAVDPVGVPVVVVAHKYDAFEQAYPEGEHRKTLCRTLRFFAHQAGASLVCTRHKDKASLTILRNMLYHHVFGSNPIDGRLLQFDHARPLVVAASSDAFAGIGKAPSVQGVLSDLSADKWQAVYNEYFPYKAGKAEKQDLTMVEAEQFAEEAVDELRRQKRDELVKLRKAAEFDAKLRSAAEVQP